jgi:hypothetical protein
LLLIRVTLILGLVVICGVKSNATHKSKSIHITYIITQFLQITNIRVPNNRTEVMRTIESRSKILPDMAMHADDNTVDGSDDENYSIERKEAKT